MKDGIFQKFQDFIIAQPLNEKFSFFYMFFDFSGLATIFYNRTMQVA
jgi:hypothetical protein